MIINGYDVSFSSDENVLELIVVIVNPVNILKTMTCTI